MERWHTLTKQQQQIYDLIYNQNMKVAEVANTRGVSRVAIYKTIRLIQQKLNITTPKKHQKREGLQNKSTVDVPLKRWRLHALQYYIYPYYYYPRYFSTIKERGNRGKIGDFRFIIYKNAIRMQSMKGVAYWHEDKNTAIEMGEAALMRDLEKLKDLMGFEYDKEGRINIKCANYELAYEDCPMAKAHAKLTNKNKLYAHDKDDKVFFTLDKSKTHEREYIGANVFENSEKLEPYIQDLTFNNPLTNSQLTSRVADLLQVIEKQQELINKIISK